MPPALNLASISNNPTSAVLTGATALAANTARRYWNIQNVGTNPLFILLGTGASASQYHKVLKACTGAADGTGGEWTSGVVVYQGIVTVAGTSPSYVVTEI